MHEVHALVVAHGYGEHGPVVVVSDDLFSGVRNLHLFFLAEYLVHPRTFIFHVYPKNL